ncbi:hypothetical protein C2W62_09305 [Candidatus Entotheonella serta]|nr:hypothetical protein C2W62_09305 [Candidatus Entotheonella serta]
MQLGHAKLSRPQLVVVRLLTLVLTHFQVVLSQLRLVKPANGTCSNAVSISIAVRRMQGE